MTLRHAIDAFSKATVGCNVKYATVLFDPEDNKLKDQSRLMFASCVGVEVGAQLLRWYLEMLDERVHNVETVTHEVLANDLHPARLGEKTRAALLRALMNGK